MDYSHKQKIEEPQLAYDYRSYPLLEFTKSLFLPVPLNNVYLLCVQHIVPTTYLLFQILINLGLPPRNISILGKCYSTNPNTFEKMLTNGLDISKKSLNFTWDMSFDINFKKNIQEFYQSRKHRIYSHEISKIIVLDDGGYLINTVNHDIHKNCDIVGIEQTTAGYELLRRKKLNFPVINVARSETKLNYESPIIATVIKERIEKIITKNNRCLILGNGSIGQHLHSVLLDKFDISLCDQKSGNNLIPYKELHTVLDQYDIIIGCTGKTSIPYSYHKLLKKNTILVSASSSDREFDAVYFRQKVTPSQNCHSNILVDDIFIANCGFPINFDDDYDTVDGTRFQLTRSLLLAAILQAANMESFINHSLCPLNKEIQNEITTFMKGMS